MPFINQKLSLFKRSLMSANRRDISTVTRSWSFSLIDSTPTVHRRPLHPLIYGNESKRCLSDSKANQGSPIPGNLPQPPTFQSIEEERRYKKARLAGAFRIFGKFGYDEGAAGHITLRDPEFRTTFWTNPFGMDFSLIKVSDLIRVDDAGNVVEGKHPVNAAAFSIHSAIHKARPDVEAAAHSHSPAGRAWSTLGRLIDPITQDSCAFYQDLSLYSDYGGVAFGLSEGQRIANALGKKKAAILQNHGLLTVGGSVDEAVWWYVSLERSCSVQLLAEAANRGKPIVIGHEVALESFKILGNPFAGWFQFQSLYQRILKENNDFLQ